MGIYLKVPGANGDVTTKGYEGWIELFDVDFGGITNPTKMRIGQSQSRMHTFPAFGQLTIIKQLDKSSVHFFEAAHSGKVFPQLDIHYVSTGNELFTYAKTTLKDASISHYADSFKGQGEMPEELIRLAYTHIERTFVPRDANNKPGSQLVWGYDLVTAQKA
ncbi:MAG: type VI secretion system tube protein Hcp [Gammaproteobacteria bacterium]|nr:type VI secretion system tube protein Hcp [Gammaproteobacteria bacterium]